MIQFMDVLMEQLKLKRASFCKRKTFVLLQKKNPADLKWNEVDVDVVAECTGFFTTKETANAHILVELK
jgi:glyceraldehyde-3-phosphate dehydrogenase/erythrose-4-phosphate dehydrogenase